MHKEARVESVGRAMGKLPKRKFHTQSDEKLVHKKKSTKKGAAKLNVKLNKRFTK